MKRGDVAILVDGKRLTVGDGFTVAAALMNSGWNVFRSSVSAEPRGPLCGMGVCHECRVTIDGVAHQRACLRVVADGMRIETAMTNAG